MELKLEDSNMAKYGSKEHKELVFDSASLEEAYKGAGDKGEGIQIWRVKNIKRTDLKAAKFGIIKVPEEEYGSFFSGDSYIILQTYMVETKKYFNLFFWLGRESSQDEIGTAAYKTVELDTLLGSTPVQHRELDGKESAKFLKLFKSFKVLKGGFESGFTKVKREEYKPRLYHLRGAKKETIVCREVECKVDSMNEGDAFILDAGLSIFIFHGKSSGIWEKRRALDIVSGIKSEVGRGKAKKIFVDTESTDKEFWDTLGGKSEVPDALPSDEKTAPKPKVSKSELWKLSEETGTIKLTKVSDKPKKSDVHNKDVFLLDLGNEVLVHVGSKCSTQERYESIGVAIRYLKANKLDLTTPITRYIEGGDCTGFTSHLA
mmetsp:Transcript_18738/g.29773  ORF Transcript_18738/g.29773 Transcript_18738/m.29773 type:complete len:375 (-) Transcript_18738:239-1363(-)